MAELCFTVSFMVSVMYDECHVMLSVIMLIVINVIVVLLSVVAPL